MASKIPSKETVRQLREQYPAGTRIELQSMEDPYSKLRPGDRGSVMAVDDTGTVHVTWDSGSGLGLVYGVDSYKKVTEPIYQTGADAWRDNAVTYGLEEANELCGRYLSMQSHSKQPDDEKQFCRELFAAMYEATAKRTDPAKLIYPYEFEKANDRLETSYFHKSCDCNAQCAKAIDTAINASCFGTYLYNLDLAAMAVIREYGFDRVNAVLAHYIQTHESDGRYSHANKEWARQFKLTEGAFEYSYMSAHPILLEDFTKYARKLYDAVDAERYSLPGRAESGTTAHGYEIVRSITFDDNRGFAIGLNPDAPSQYVCWQFTAENGVRDLYWGHYADDLQSAVDNYVARTIVHMSGGQAHEILNPLAAVEMSTEQNYNMIDGQRNNMASPRPDLMDGQTHEEIRELAPGTLPEAKPSVLEQIREAKKVPPAPRKHRDQPAKDRPEL